MKILKLICPFLFLSLLLIGFFNPGIVAATTITFSDPVGDFSGNIDVTNMVLDFDNSGNCTIDIDSDSAHPFISEFRINIILFNGTRRETFRDILNDYTLGSSTLSIQLTGTNPIIGDWLVADAIATSTFDGLGNPSGTPFFRTSVADLPFQGPLVSEDMIGINDRRINAPVPEPSTMLLLGVGLIGIAGATRRNLKK